MNKEKLINLPIYTIVRYKDNGDYDCVWSSGHMLRDAIKKCKQLNEDYHKVYGKYIVEDIFGNKY